MEADILTFSGPFEAVTLDIPTIKPKKDMRVTGIAMIGDRKEIRKAIKEHAKNGFMEFGIYHGDRCLSFIKIRSNKWYKTFKRLIPLPTLVKGGESYHLKPELKYNIWYSNNRNPVKVKTKFGWFDDIDRIKFYDAEKDFLIYN